MKHPPEKILETALRLFNREGLAKITLRGIAKEMGISQGNLNYHFRKREEIVEALYRHMVAEMDGVVAAFGQEPPGLRLLLDLLLRTMDIFYKYRFLMLDFVQVMRAHPEVQQHYAGLQVMRRQQFGALFTALHQSGNMRSAEYPGEFDALYDRLQVMADFWLSSAVISYGELDAGARMRYFQALSGAIYPYLTEAGKAEFVALQPLFQDIP